ncbi:TIM-barrel domain-containing protein [Lactobacillus agrestimuris]|uniref:TIM-barrel domain-containing protein n=1 Tax=Lactobacillus agrestimuris TaxID=2941328 RepID=UPI002042FB5F|nr:TIM-barrel domain-containing protein [Lactobacillus agrestimuris]
MTENTQTNRHQLGQLLGANKRDNFYELHYATGEVARLYILGDGIFRYFLDPSNRFNESRDSIVNLDQFNNQYFENSRPRATSDSLIIKSGNYQIIFQQKPAIMSIFDENLHRTRMTQSSPLEIGHDQITEILKQNKNEFYFGGGLQNGSFSHKGKRINIKRDHITGDGGVISQVPFFWSNAGFGELRNTNTDGEYDFGKVNEDAAVISHNSGVFDNFYLIGNSPKDILRKYFALTGKPLMPPKYALDLGHIGNFLSTKWAPGKAKQRNANMFEDNNYYLRTNSDEAASAKASLNGEEQYQFSARAMIDRYQKQGFNLGWMIPNFKDENTNIDALTLFNEYAQTHGVEPGMWLTGNDTSISKNTSFILTDDSSDNVLNRDTQMLKSNLNRRRPLIFANTADAGSQTRAALIFGDNGGNWENISTQVAGFLGANLSGEPLVGSGIDGTVGGGNAQIAIRDFEWKSFTPLLFNIDDQGEFSKNPFTYNNKMTRINHAYLELRDQLKNYLYTLVHAAQNGEPIVRALFIDFPHEQINYTERVSHEFMLGPNLLISPINSGREDGQSNSRKDNLYLPDHRTMWIDLFSGEKYLGGRVYNKLSYPIWHLPVFVRGGSIFDLGKRNYVFYPQGKSQINFYADNDYVDYAHNHSETKITSNLDSSMLTITIDPTKGDFSGMESELPTALNIMCDSYPDGLTVKINDQVINMQEYGTVDTFAHAKEGFFYNTNYSWMPEFDQYRDSTQPALQIKLAKRDISDSKITITIQNFSYGNQTLVHSITDSVLRAPKQPTIDMDSITAHSLTVNWPKTADKVQIELNGVLHDGIDGSSFTFHELEPNTKYILRLRNVAGNKVSEWSDPFGAYTKRAAIDYAIQNISTESNYESKSNHPLEYLTDLKLASEWESTDTFDESNPLVLTFNFNDIEKLSRMTFVPRNINHDGDPIEVGIEISKDGQDFKPYGDRYTWKADSKNKVIGLRDVVARAIRLTVYKSSGNFVGAKEVMFFRDKNS